VKDGFGEDADWGAAGGAERDGLHVFGVVGGLGDGIEGDLKSMLGAAELILVHVTATAGSGRPELTRTSGSGAVRWHSLLQRLAGDAD